jgi:hypothetical protein
LATALSDLRTLVNRRLGNHLQWAAATDTGDGNSALFRLPNQNIVTSTLIVQVDGVNASGSLDDESGWYTFTVAPALSAVLTFEYAYVVWLDVRVDEAINSAIDELFGKFHVEGFNDDLLSEGGAEFVAKTSADVDLDPEDRITRVEFWTGSRWAKTERWSVAVQNGKKVIIFEVTPAIGTNIRISYHARPGNLTLDADTLETTSGLPTRAKEPIVLLACSSLITERMHHRIRDDRAHNTQGDNPVKSYEIQNDANYLRQQAEVLASKLRMAPLKGRAV